MSRAPRPSGPPPHDPPFPGMAVGWSTCALCDEDLWRAQSLAIGACLSCRLMVRNGALDAILWAPVVGYERRYEVSTEGEVRGFRTKRRLAIDRSGRYLRVTLDGTRFYLHDVVMAAFVGPKPFGQMVLHRDDDGRNPRLPNLSYGSGAENCADAIRNGKRTATRTQTEAGDRRSEKGSPP